LELQREKLPSIIGVSKKRDLLEGVGWKEFRLLKLIPGRRDQN